MLRRHLILPVLFLLTSALLCGCFQSGPKSDPKYDKAVREYGEKIAEDGSSFFNELTEEVIGRKADSISFGFRHASTDFLEAAPLPIDKLIHGSPVLTVSFYCSDDTAFTDEEIHDILAEMVRRGYILDVTFNGATYRVYQVYEDGITVDITTGKDGGAYHERETYPL